MLHKRQTRPGFVRGQRVSHSSFGVGPRVRVCGSGTGQEAECGLDWAPRGRGEHFDFLPRFPL